MRDLLKATKAWYLRVFLPYELPDHPLYSDGSSKYDNEFLQEIDDWVEEGLDIKDIFSAPYQAEYRVSSDPDTTHRF